MKGWLCRHFEGVMAFLSIVLVYGTGLPGWFLCLRLAGFPEEAAAVGSYTLTVLSALALGGPIALLILALERRLKPK